MGDNSHVSSLAYSLLFYLDLCYKLWWASLNIMIMPACVLSHFSCVWLFATLWTVALQAPRPWDSPGKNTGLGCHALFQGIFPTQWLNPCLMSLELAGRFFTTALPGKPYNMIYLILIYPFCKWKVKPSVQFSRSVMSDSLRPPELQHARPPCP